MYRRPSRFVRGIRLLYVDLGLGNLGTLNRTSVYACNDGCSVAQLLRNRNVIRQMPQVCYGSPTQYCFGVSCGAAGTMQAPRLTLIVLVGSMSATLYVHAMKVRMALFHSVGTNLALRYARPSSNVDGYRRDPLPPMTN